MIAENWPIITACIAATVWLIRLEGRVNTNEKVADTQFKTLTMQVESMDKKIDRILEHQLNSRSIK